MSSNDVKNVLKYRLERTQNVAEMTALAADLVQRDEPELVFDLCRYAEHQLKELDEARLRTQQRRAEIQKIRAKPLLITDATKKLLDLEEHLFNTLPEYLRIPEATNQNLRYQFAETMVRAALNHKNNAISVMKRDGKQEIDDDAMDRSVNKIIEEAMKYLQAPPQMLQMCRVLDQSGAPRLALQIAEFAQKTLLEIRQKLKERTELAVKHSLLEQEGNRLKRVKKELAKEKVSELQDLRKELDEFKMPYAESLSTTDIDALEQATLQVALVMIACAVNFKKTLMDKKKLVIQKKDVFTKKEKEALADPQELDNLIKKVLNWALEKNRVEDPSHMIQLAKTITDPDLPFVFSIGETVRARLKELKGMADAKLKFNKELEQLQDEREKLLGQWKFLSDDKQARLYELEFQNDVNVVMVPKYRNASKDKFEALELSISQFILDAIYDRRDKFEDGVKNPNKFSSLPRLSSDEIAVERKKYAGLVMDVITNVEDPNQLFQIAKHVQSRKDSDSVLKIGEKCQQTITAIEEQREVRAPLQAELNSLIALKEDLTRRNRAFDKQDRLTELTQMIAKLNEWPEYADLFNHHQYDSLNLDIVRVMTSAILDNKTALEDDIARMFRENAPEDIDHNKIEKDRNAIQARIRQLTKQCLTKFSNPVYLLKFAKDMKARRETEIVLEVTEKCLQKIRELNEQRSVRKPLQKRLDELELAKEDCTKSGKSFTGEEEIASLKAQLEGLPIWPHFAQIYKDHQYDQTSHNAVEVALIAVLDDKDAHEAQIAKQFYEDRTALDYKKIGLERAHKTSNIDQVMKWCLENVRDPSHLQALCRTVAGRQEPLLVLQIASHCFEQMKDLKKLRAIRDSLQCQIEILSEEEKFLVARKKSLDDEASADLTKFKKKLAELSVPDFIGTDYQSQTIADDLALLITNNVYDKKAQLKQKIESDAEMTEERKSFWTDYITESEKKASDLLFQFVDSPDVLLNLIKILRSRKEFELTLKLGTHCFNKLAYIRELQAKHVKSDQEFKLLTEEEELQSKVMKYLTGEKKRRLRAARLENKLRRGLVSFYQSSFNVDNFALQVAQQLITISLDMQAQAPDSTTSAAADAPVDGMEVDDGPAGDEDEEMQEEEEEEEQEEGDGEKTPKAPVVLSPEKQKLKDQTAKIVKQCLEYIYEIPNLIALARLLNDRTEYVHVITTGKKCQERITDKRKEFQQHEDLKKEYERLDNLRLQQLLSKDASEEEKENLAAKLEATKEALDDLPTLAESPEKELATLNTQLLEVTELIISAAKIENLDKELRAQTILAFKADTTTERWDQVRALTPEEEWAQVKEELVVYVLKQDTNLNDKIELLLKDGLYKQVIDVFPKPSGAKGELALLLKVYKTIEEKEPTMLDKMYPIVGRYMKRCFQEQKYNQMNAILDRFQRRFSGLLVKLLAAACDMVMLEIMPSQYSAFVNMLKDMKHRLESVQKREDWNDFFTSFKKAHAGKKKLMQMVNLIGDSVWDLDAIMERPKAQKVKKEGNDDSDRPKKKRKVKKESHDDAEYQG